MGSFISLIENLSLGLYIICGFFLIWNARALMIARYELKLAQYGLEREMAERQGGRALTMIMLMIEILVMVWAISNLASPAWSEGLPDDPVNSQSRQFQTNVPAGDGSFEITRSSGPTEQPILSTARPPVTPPGTLGPRSQRAGCDPDRAWIEIPANGMYVFEDITVIGTAAIDSFASYRFEIRNADGGDYSVYSGDYNVPVTDGPLGSLSPAVLLPDEYRFRVVVFDTARQPQAYCEITITITEPPATPTPIGAGVAEE